jgi:Zn-dependent protease with chaperone function
MDDLHDSRECLDELTALPEGLIGTANLPRCPKMDALVKSVANALQMKNTPQYLANSSNCPIITYPSHNTVAISKSAGVFNSDKQLEAFIGHEFSHIKNNDPSPSFLLAKTALCILPITAFAVTWKTLKKSRAIKALYGVAAATATLPLVWGINHLAQRQSRANEQRADLEGCSRTELTTAMIEVFHKDNSWYRLLRVLIKQTHPTHTQRISYLEKHLKEQVQTLGI